MGSTGSGNGNSTPPVTYVGATPAPQQEERSHYGSALDFASKGSSGLREAAGIITEERLPLLRGMRELLLYREMADNNPIVGMILRAMKTWIMDGKWSVEQSRDTQQAAEAAWLIESCMDDMSHPWDMGIYNGLSHIDMGFSLAEICYKRRLGGQDASEPLTRSRYNDGYIGWRKFAYRSQDTLDRWEFTGDGSLAGMWQNIPPNVCRPGGSQGMHGKFFIPIQKAVLFRLPGYNDSPQGRSILRNAVTTYNDLRHFNDIENIGAEKDLVGMPHMTLPEEFFKPDAEEWMVEARRVWKEVAGLMRRNALECVITPPEKNSEDKPTGYALKLLQSGGTRQMDIDKIIRRKESRIAISMLAEFALVGIESGGGMDGGGVVDSKKDAFSLSLNAIPRAMATVLNHFAVNPLCRINGIQPEDYPTICVSDVSAPSLEQMADFVMKITNAGMLMYDVGVERKLREMGGLPQRDATELAGNKITGMSQPQIQTTEQEAEGSGIPGDDPGSPGALMRERGSVATNVTPKPAPPTPATGGTP